MHYTLQQVENLTADLHHRTIGINITKAAIWKMYQTLSTREFVFNVFLPSAQAAFEYSLQHISFKLMTRKRCVITFFIPIIRWGINCTSHFEDLTFFSNLNSLCRHQIITPRWFFFRISHWHNEEQHIYFLVVPAKNSKWPLLRWKRLHYCLVKQAHVEAFDLENWIVLKTNCSICLIYDFIKWNILLRHNEVTMFWKNKNFPSPRINSAIWVHTDICLIEKPTIESVRAQYDIHVMTW